MRKKKETADEEMGRIIAEHVNANTAKGLDSTGRPFEKIPDEAGSGPPSEAVREYREYLDFIGK